MTNAMQKLIEQIKVPLSEEERTRRAADRLAAYAQAAQSLMDDVERWLAPLREVGVQVERTVAVWREAPPLPQVSTVVVTRGSSVVSFELVGIRVVGMGQQARGVINLVFGRQTIPLLWKQDDLWVALPLRGSSVPFDEDVLAEILDEIWF